MALNHNLTADRVSSPMDKITAIVSLKDKASTEVKVMVNLKAMAAKATEIRDMAIKVLLKAMGSPRVMDSLKVMATRAMETQATATKVLLRAMGNLRFMGSLRATDSPRATGSPKDMVTKATTTRDTEARAMEAKAMTLKVTATKAMVPKAHPREAMTDHQAMVAHKVESNLTTMTTLMMLLHNISKDSRQ